MTILETIPILESSSKYEILIFLGVLVGGAGLLMAIFAFSKDYMCIGTIFTIITICAISLLVFGIVSTATEPKIDTGRKQYIVRLDKDVSAVDFYDKYKIVAHTKYTDVYTVEEITND